MRSIDLTTQEVIMIDIDMDAPILATSGRIVPCAARSTETTEQQFLHYKVFGEIIMESVPQRLRSVEGKKVVLKSWNEITLEYLQSLYDHIPTRVEELQRVRGYPTKY